MNSTARVTRPLRECGQLHSGGTPSKADESLWNGELPWFSSKEMKSFELGDTELHVSERAASRGTTLVPTGTVLFVVRGMSLANEFRVGVTTRPATFNQDVKALVPAPDVDGRYLARCLRWMEPRILAATESSTHGTKRLPSGTFDGLSIPLPLLDEQRRIANILDKADAIRRKRKQAIALTEELLRSAFLEMFGDPVTNPKRWPVKPLGDVIESLDAGWSANGEARHREGDEFGVLKVSAVTSGIFKPEEHKAVAADAIDRELVTPRAGDLLFSRANTRELVAATCLVERDEPKLFLPDKLWRVVPRATATTAAYLRFLLADGRLRYELTKTATGTSGSMLNVSMDKLRTLRAPFPQVEVQKRFSEFVWGTLRAKAHHEDAQRESETLFSSLVARAFSGGLTA